MNNSKNGCGVLQSFEHASGLNVWNCRLSKSKDFTKCNDHSIHKHLSNIGRHQKQKKHNLTKNFIYFIKRSKNKQQYRSNILK